MNALTQSQRDIKFVEEFTRRRELGLECPLFVLRVAFINKAIKNLIEISPIPVSDKETLNDCEKSSILIVVEKLLKDFYYEPFTQLTKARIRWALKEEIDFSIAFAKNPTSILCKCVGLEFFEGYPEEPFLHRV